jgi:hypothetical protein
LLAVGEAGFDGGFEAGAFLLVFAFVLIASVADSTDEAGHGSAAPYWDGYDAVEDPCGEADADPGECGPAEQGVSVGGERSDDEGSHGYKREHHASVMIE